jgi:hypothetical protein
MGRNTKIIFNLCALIKNVVNVFHFGILTFGMNSVAEFAKIPGLQARTLVLCYFWFDGCSRTCKSSGLPSARILANSATRHFKCHSVLGEFGY